MNLGEMKSSPASFTDIQDWAITDPFSEDAINQILAPSLHDAGQLAIGETNFIELKENFGFNSLGSYAKTIAAFANTRGGYIVFGVKNHPKILTGMSGDAFEKLDPQRLTNELNVLFSPKITYRTYLAIVGSKKIGFIYTFPSIVKPVMAKHDKLPEVKEGEIYYRYEGRSEKIKYPELRTIIEDQRRRETELWLKYVSQIAYIGVDNAAIVDTTTGTVTGSSNKTQLIDEKLLEQIAFVTEGYISEVEGAPVLNLVDNVQEIPSGLIQVKEVEVPVEIHVDRPTAIRTRDIVRAFLQQQVVADPKLYIEQICYAESGILPVYYFGSLAGLNITEIIRIVETTKMVSERAKKKLLKRLETEREHFSMNLPIHEYPPTAKKKQQIYQALLKQEFDLSVPYWETPYVLQTIRCLSYPEIDKSYLFPILLKLYEDYYTDKSNPANPNNFRLALCHLDSVLYQDEVRK